MRQIRQAGAIAFRQIDGSLHVLLVRSRKNRDRRVFPKGHVEKGESGAEAAIRELEEEAGVSGRIVARVGAIKFPLGDSNVRVEYFLVKCTEDGLDHEHGRDPEWVTVPKALKLVTFKSAQRLLSKAAKLM